MENGGSMSRKKVLRRAAYERAAVAILLTLLAPCASAKQIDIHGPPGSAVFGQSVTALPNGNFVVTDPGGPVSNVGAVYVYSATGTLISTLTGSSANDQAGSGGIVLLGGSRLLVLSPSWNNGAAAQAGAVTWIDGDVGLNGIVSPANSLIGAHAGDLVGYDAKALANGNYVVASPFWSNGAKANAGAVTWGNGATGMVGTVSSGNSLVGSNTGDQVGVRMTALGNGNYVVGSPAWANGLVLSAGAATWGNGAGGTIGAVSSGNSLVGTSTNDQVGIALTALSNGHYVVASQHWKNGTAAKAGAVTWGNGAGGTIGTVSASNSLVGTTAGDRVGSGVTALNNGHYVVGSPYWSNGAVSVVGAATWRNGTGSSNGVVSAANSLVGSSANDQVGLIVTALTNGHYVVGSPSWKNGATAGAGAATWGNGASGLIGSVSTGNSLVGTTANAGTGIGVTALSDGNYVVASPYWTNGTATNAGAITWRDGSGSAPGIVYVGNSLVGASQNANVGYGAVALSGGNYAVPSYLWDASLTSVTNAITWSRAGGLTTGTVTAMNSLVGTASDSPLNSSFYILGLADGRCLVRSPYWQNGADAQAGAISLMGGNFRTKGAIAAWNSVIGGVADGGSQLSYDYDAARQRLLVGRPAENVVSLFTMDQIFADDMDP